ncbi:MAG: hypothetical protein H0S82_01205 [Anaerolineaceae bacterium]|nr:hypothetical protein [Anaerolineaceae bacterium]
MVKPARKARTVLRVLGIVALALYILFLIMERVPLSFGVPFAETSVYLLFLIFVLGFILLWKNELVSGLILMVWHVLQWCLVFWVWPDGDMTLIFGLPIGILGLFIFIYGLSKRRASRNNEV